MGLGKINAMMLTEHPVSIKPRPKHRRLLAKCFEIRAAVK
jgi:hypothetical protein